MNSTLFNFNDPSFEQNGGIILNNPINDVMPLFSYIGGKQGIKHILVNRLPNFHIKSYCELFSGALTLFAQLQPPKAYISDWNEDLMNLYILIKEKPAVVENYLETVFKPNCNNKQYYIDLRNLDRSPDFNKMSKEDKALRWLYLLKASFGGRVRFTKQGYADLQWGGEDDRPINAHRVSKWSKALNNSNTEIMSGDFEEVIKSVPIKDTFFYLDPPYHQGEKTRLEYTPELFDESEQTRLKRLCDKITDGGGVLYVK